MSAAADFLRARDFLLAHRTDVPAASAGFTWPRLDYFNWALDYFDVMAADNHRTALWITGDDPDPAASDCRISFAELSARSNQTANFLRRLGVRRGDRILIMLGNQRPLWEILLAACKLGAVAIPAATLLAPDDLRDRIGRGQVRHVIAAADQAPKFEHLAGGYTRITTGVSVPLWQRYEDSASESSAFEPDAFTRATDPLLIYFTSGTTSKPKLVLHSHQSYPVGHLTTMYWLGLREGDIHWNISSPGWAKHAWSCVFAPWNAGATVFVHNYARFQAKAILTVLTARAIKTLCAPPTVWRMLVQERLADYCVELREVASAGEPLNPEVIAQVKAAWGLTIRDGYGQTETTALIGNPPGGAVKPGSMGHPLPGYRIDLLDAAGHPGDEGEICIRLTPPPTGLMLGYGGQAETAAALRDGYYHTGDIAARDAEGYITYIGRADDVFKASDYRVSPFELESVLVEHPAVAEAAVVPSPDPLRLAVPKGFLVVAPGYVPCRELARELFIFLRQKVAPYKRIRRLEFCELPKTISGKIRRVELRAREQHRASSLPRNELEFFEEDFPELSQRNP